MGKVFFTLIAIVVGLFIYMKATDKELYPPVKVSFRGSYIAGKVLQVSNTSAGETLHCKLRVVNKKSGSRSSYEFAVFPGAVQEVGLMEMGWCFEPGEKCTIEVDRYILPVRATVPQ